MDDQENIMEWFLAQGGPLKASKSVAAKERVGKASRRRKAPRKCGRASKDTPSDESPSDRDYSPYSKAEGAIGRVLVCGWVGFVTGIFFAIILWWGWS